jgi:hypothetical protein
MNPLNVTALERQIEDLITSYPELAEDETLRADMVEGSTDAAAILSKIVDRMQEAEAMADAVERRMDDLAARRGTFQRRSEAMRSLALRIMTAAQVRKMPLPEVTLSIRSVPPSLVINDESQVPAEFIKTETKIDRAKLKDALKAGTEIPGACLSNGGESLSVRSK